MAKKKTTKKHAKKSYTKKSSAKKSHVRKKHVRKTMSAVDVFSESIKATFNLNIFIIPLIVIVFALIAMFIIGIISLPFVVIGAGFFVAINIAPLIAVVIIGAIIIIALIVVASAIINGFYYKSIDQYLNEKKVSIKENIKFAFGKWQKLVGISLIEIFISIIIMFLIIVPAMSFIIGTDIVPPDIVTTSLTSASETALITALIPAFVVLSLAVWILMIVMLFITPLLFLWFPTAVFEKKHALECVRKGYDTGKSKYLRNFGALLLMGVVGTLVVGIQMVDPTVIIGIILSIWIELAAIIMIVKIYREGA